MASIGELKAAAEKVIAKTGKDIAAEKDALSSLEEQERNLNEAAAALGGEEDDDERWKLQQKRGVLASMRAAITTKLETLERQQALAQAAMLAPLQEAEQDGLIDIREEYDEDLHGPLRSRTSFPEPVGLPASQARPAVNAGQFVPPGDETLQAQVDGARAAEPSACASTEHAAGTGAMGFHSYARHSAGAPAPGFHSPAQHAASAPGQGPPGQGPHPSAAQQATKSGNNNGPSTRTGNAGGGGPGTRTGNAAGGPGAKLGTASGAPSTKTGNAYPPSGLRRGFLYAPRAGKPLRAGPGAGQSTARDVSMLQTAVIPAPDLSTADNKASDGVQQGSGDKARAGGRTPQDSGGGSVAGERNPGGQGPYIHPERVHERELGASQGNERGAMPEPGGAAQGKEAGAARVPGGAAQGNQNIGMARPGGAAQGNEAGAARMPGGAAQGNEAGAARVPGGAAQGNESVAMPMQGTGRVSKFKQQRLEMKQRAGV